MRLVSAFAVAVVVASSPAFAQARSLHAKLVERYEEEDTWKNRANFYVGARTGVAIPTGATDIATTVSLELGVAPTTGFGFGMRLIYTDRPPGAPIFGIAPTRYGFGAAADMRFNIATIDPLTLYPSLSVGFLAGPDFNGKNMVLPLFNPGVGAKVKLGNFYGTLEFGFAGFTIPFITLGIGYEADRRAARAEAWAREQEELAAEAGVPVELPARKPVSNAAQGPVAADDFWK